MDSMLARAVKKLADIREGWLPVLCDLFEKLLGKNGEWWLEALKRFLRREDPDDVLKNTADQISRWTVLLREKFNIKFNSVLLVPERKSGFDRLIVVQKGLTPSKVVEVMRRDFNVETYGTDLDKALDLAKEERSNVEKSYAIWVRDCIEADDENKNKSANDISAEGQKALTLLERLLLELVYFSETHRHLDEKNITLCGGSRRTLGGVPCVLWAVGSRKLCVGWDRRHGRSTILRSREVVS